MTNHEATGVLIALVTDCHHGGHDAGAILAGLDRTDLLHVLGVAVGMLTAEIEQACRCCVQLTVDEVLQGIALVAARDGGA